MKKQLLIALGMLVCISMYSQGVLTPLKEWSTTAGTQHFFYKSVTTTDVNDNVYVAGATFNASGNYDLLVVKYDDRGNQEWAQQIDGYANFQDFATALFLNDTAVYVTGTISDTSVWDSDIITLKLDINDGSVIWQKTFQGAGNAWDCGADIYVKDSGYVFVTGAGFNSSFDKDYITLRYNSSGTLQWSSIYDYEGENDGAVKLNYDGRDVHVLGIGQTTADTTVYDAVLVSISEHDGLVSGTSAGSGGGSNVDYVYDFTRDNDGNLYVAGQIEVANQGYDSYLAKLDSNLVFQWEVTYNGADSLDESANGVKVDNSTGYVYIAGYTTSDARRKDWLIIKYDNSGSQQWIEEYNDTLDGDDEAMSLELKSGTEIIVTGYDSTATNEFDYYTIKYDDSGTKIWDVRETRIAGHDKALNMAIDEDGDIIITGESQKADGSYEYKTVKYVEKQVITPADSTGDIVSGSLRYFENRGQLLNTNDSLIPSIRYYSINSTPTYYIADKSFSFVFGKVDTLYTTIDTLQRIDVSFTNANTLAKTYPMEEQKEYLNYFLEHIPDGVTEVFANKRLVTTDLYSNIDLEYSSNQNGLKYYFIVKPGGNPSSIKMQFTGATSFNLDGGTNALTITSMVGSITFDRPNIYQLDSGNDTIHIAGWTPAWQTDGASNKYKFNVGSYDNTKALIIEIDEGNAPSSLPSIDNLDWSTFYGSSTVAVGFVDVKTDNTGNFYVTGYAWGNGFPVVSGIQPSPGGTTYADACMLKFNPTGSVSWATYYGGFGDDYGFSIGTDQSSNVFVTGYASAGFPTFNPGGGAYYDGSASGSSYDLFIVKLNPTGNMKLWATLYGDTGNEYGNELAFDMYDNIYIGGEILFSSSPYLLSQVGAYNSASGQGLVMKFQTNGVPRWITRFGGTATTGGVQSICTDKQGHLFIGGRVATGSGFPILNNGANGTYGGGSTDGFVAKFENHPNSNSLMWSTYFGGTGGESVQGMECDDNNNLLVTGSTTSNSGFPLVDEAGSLDYYQGTFGGTSDGFIAGFAPNGVLGWSTYYGDVDDEGLSDITIDDDDNAYVSGRSVGSNLPIPSPNLTGGFYQGYTPNQDDAILLSFNSSQHSIWATYYGGDNDETGYSVCSYSNTRLYMVGQTNTTNVATFPIVNLSGAYNQGANASPAGFIAAFDLTPVIVLPVNEEIADRFEFNVFPNPSGNFINILVNSPDQQDFTVSILNSIGQEVLIKKYDSGTTSLNKQMDISNLSSGIYFISIKAGDKIGCRKMIKQ